MLNLKTNQGFHPAIVSHVLLKEFTRLTDELEALETPIWAADAVLDREICTRRVIDPNCGTGVLADAAIEHGYEVHANDIFDWGYHHQTHNYDFLSEHAAHHLGGLIKGSTVFLNPPFKLSCDFFEQCRRLGARKIIMFQNFTFLTSIGRKEFWKKYPASKVYVFAERATTWRFDVPENKRKGTSTKTFAFFVWDGFNTARAPAIHLLYKGTP